MERSNDFLGLCDSLIRNIDSLREEHLRKTASDEELLCGDWWQEDSVISFRVFAEQGRYMIETQTANKVNGHVWQHCGELKSDDQGNLHTGYFETAVRYDRIQDLLTVEGYGEYKRKDTKNEK